MTLKIAYALLMAAALLPVGNASADLMLHPHRVVLEGKQRTAQIEMINRGATTSVYRLRLVRRHMTDLGEFVEAKEPLAGELLADDLIRYSPRHVELAPGASQTVRVTLRKPADLADGEYRSHLLFERLPDAVAASPLAESTDQRETDIELTALVSVSIPIIVRQGGTAATVALSDLRLESSPAGESLLALTLQRSGNRSVYGDLTAEFIPKKGAARVLGTAKGVAVYTPNALRRGRLILRPGAREQLHTGTLRVVYREPESRGGAHLAEAVLHLP